MKSFASRAWIFSSLVVLSVMASVSLPMFSWAAVPEHAQGKTMEFASLVQESEDALLIRLNAYEQALRQGSAFFNGSQRVERNQWRSYIESLEISKNFPGINGIGYIAAIDKNDLASFLEQARRDGAPNFEVHPDGLDVYFIITYIEPVIDNKEAVGLNIAFEINRWTAAIAARDTGKPAITGSIILVQDQKQSPGFLLLLPLYKNGMPTDTTEQRRAALAGWIFAPFIGNNLLQNLTTSQSTLIDLKVIDGDKEDLPMYDSNPSTAKFVIKKTVDVYQKKWTLIWSSTLAFERRTMP